MLFMSTFILSNLLLLPTLYFFIIISLKTLRSPPLEKSPSQPIPEDGIIPTQFESSSSRKDHLLQNMNYASTSQIQPIRAHREEKEIKKKSLSSSSSLQIESSVENKTMDDVKPLIKYGPAVLFFCTPFSVHFRGL